jgi:beta-xylosidase
MTGSAAAHASGLNSKTIHVWRSTDLLHWQSLGGVWSVAGDGPAHEVNAPEIHFIKGAFYVVYGLKQGGIRLIKSDSGAQGPYEDMGLLWSKGHDPSLFEDTDGKVYLLCDADRIALLDLEKMSLAHQPRALLWEDESKLDRDSSRMGGLFMVRKNRQYYLFYSVSDTRLDGRTRDVYVSQADRPNGPFKTGYLAIPHASQTSVFLDALGHEWGTFCAPPQDTWAVFSGRPGLVPLTLTDERRFRPQGTVILEKGPVARLQPVFDKPLVSPSVTLGHDGQYYMVASNSSWQAPTAECHVSLWRSRTLERWEPLGDILNFDEDLANELSQDRSVPIMSAELKYSPSRTTYYLVFTTLDTKAKTWLFHSISGKPEGPFVNVKDGFMVEGVDGFLYEEREVLYLLWSNGKIAKLNQKVTGLDGPVHQLTTEGGLPIGSEGMCLIKAGKTYIWTAAQWHGTDALSRTYDLVAAVSDTLLGPYRSRQFVMPHAGHSTLFQDATFQWHAVFSGYDKTAPFRNRLGLMNLDIKTDGTVIPVPED